MGNVHRLFTHVLAHKARTFIDSLQGRKNHYVIFTLAGVLSNPKHLIGIAIRVRMEFTQSPILTRALPRSTELLREMDSNHRPPGYGPGKLPLLYPTMFDD